VAIESRQKYRVTNELNKTASAQQPLHLQAYFGLILTSNSIVSNLCLYLIMSMITTDLSGVRNSDYWRSVGR